MEEYNASLPSKNVIALPQTADDYMELAENAGAKKKKLEYLSKALELEPDNLDAARMLAEVNAKNPEDLLEALSSLIEKGNSSMEKEGYFQDCMGDFWGVLETRPYMRLRHSYLELLIQCGMMGKAVNEAEELLRLCEGDNLGIRYALMHLYAYFENEDGALALHKKYDEYEESQMLFPLAVLYYKKAEQKGFFSELARNLRYAGFTVKAETEEGLLPVELDGQPLCLALDTGTVRYWKENVAGDVRNRALDKVVDITKLTAEYMRQM